MCPFLYRAGREEHAVTILARILPLAAAFAAALAFGAQSQAQLPKTGVSLALSFGPQPSLNITPLTAGVFSFYSAESSGGETLPPPPGEVAVEFAADYALSTPAPGAAVGEAALLSLSGDSVESSSFAVVNGAVTADDPTRYASDPSALACAPGPYLAVWKVTSSVFGLSYTLPLFVEHPAGDTRRVELRFCPTPLVGADGKPVTPKPVPLVAASFLLGTIIAPTGRGSYTSSAFVTPEGSNGAPDPSATVEARFLAPIPHTLTLKSRYDAKAHDAVLTGRVTEEGKPQAGAAVQYIRSSTASLPRAVRTSRTGTFTIRVRIAATTTFLVLVPDSTGDCPGASPAPRGCASLTVAGTNVRATRVAVRR